MRAFFAPIRTSARSSTCNGRPVPGVPFGLGRAADRRRVDSVLTVLDTVPEIGRSYDPLYQAARPTEPVLVFYAGNYGLYHQIDEARRAVNVLFMEDQRRDPLARFSSD